MYVFMHIYPPWPFWLKLRLESFLVFPPALPGWLKGVTLGVTRSTCDSH